jgi:hypothetical protein
LLLCYGDALRRLNLTVLDFGSSFDFNEEQFSCPSNSSAPLCCEDAFKCSGFNERRVVRDDDVNSNDDVLLFSSSRGSLSLTCGYDADMSFYVLGANPYTDNESFTACCDSNYIGPFSKNDPLESGSGGGAPGGVQEGPLLGIERCCGKGEVPNDDDSYAPCENSDRCRVSKATLFRRKKERKKEKSCF